MYIKSEKQKKSKSLLNEAPAGPGYSRVFYHSTTLYKYQTVKITSSCTSIY